MKKALLDAIHKQDAAVSSAEREWEQQQREVPVSDVTSGLTDEYLFDDSLTNRMNEAAAAKLVTGKLTYTDGRNRPRGRSRGGTSAFHSSLGRSSNDPAFLHHILPEARRSLRHVHPSEIRRHGQKRSRL